MNRLIEWFQREWALRAWVKLPRESVHTCNRCKQPISWTAQTGWRCAAYCLETYWPSK